jgi:hypothetical protein
MSKWPDADFDVAEDTDLVRFLSIWQTKLCIGSNSMHPFIGINLNTSIADFL